MSVTSSTSSWWRKPLLILHITTTVGALGAALVLTALGIGGLRGADPATVYPAAHLVEAWLVLPLALLALGTGVLMAGLTGRSPVRYWWVAVKLTITALLTLAVFFVLEPGLAAAADAATGRTAEPLTDAQRTRVAIAPAVAAVLLTVNVALGVYQPGKSHRS